MNNRRTVSLGLGIVAATCFSTLPAHSQATHNSHCLEVIDLAGQWQFAFDSVQYSRNVTLPGTTDTNGLGEPCADKTETTRLSRRFSYKGQAWYRTTFDIPEEVPEWTLLLERTKLTRVYVDGRYVGTSNNISTPQRFAQ